MGQTAGVRLLPAGLFLRCWGILGLLLLMLSIQKLILNTEDPIAQARKWGPAYAFLVGWIVALVTLTKGLKHVGLHLSTMEGNILAVVVGILLAIIGRIMMGRVKIDTKRITAISALPAWRSCSFR